MSKTSVTFKISDEELEKSLQDLMTSRIRETCVDSVKTIISEKVGSEIEEKAVKAVDKYMASYNVDNFVKSQISVIVRDKLADWSFISDETKALIRKTIDDVFSEYSIDKYIRNEVQSKIKGYVQQAFDSLVKAEEQIVTKEEIKAKTEKEEK